MGFTIDDGRAGQSKSDSASIIRPLLLLRCAVQLGFQVNQVTQAEKTAIMGSPTTVLDPRLRVLSVGDDGSEAAFVGCIPSNLLGLGAKQLPDRFHDGSSPSPIGSQLRHRLFHPSPSPSLNGRETMHNHHPGWVEQKIQLLTKIGDKFGG